MTNAQEPEIAVVVRTLTTICRWPSPPYATKAMRILQML